MIINDLLKNIEKEHNILQDHIKFYQDENSKMESEIYDLVEQVKDLTKLNHGLRKQLSKPRISGLTGMPVPYYYNS